MEWAGHVRFKIPISTLRRFLAVMGPGSTQYIPTGSIHSAEAHFSDDLCASSAVQFERGNCIFLSLSPRKMLGSCYIYSFSFKMLYDMLSRRRLRNEGLHCVRSDSHQLPNSAARP